MDERRLIDIEVKLSHQEQALSELNEVLTDQQQQLSRLEGLYRDLFAKMEALSQAVPEKAPQDERPPHY